jgi:hypothetical protein
MNLTDALHGYTFECSVQSSAFFVLGRPGRCNAEAQRGGRGELNTLFNPDTWSNTMPWEEKSIMHQREEFVLLASREGANVRVLCRRFQISPTAGYKWDWAT